MAFLSVIRKHCVSNCFHCTVVMLQMLFSNSSGATVIDNKKKVCDVATSPLRPSYTPKAACISFGMRGRVLDVINHAKF